MQSRHVPNLFDIFNPNFVFIQMLIGQPIPPENPEFLNLYRLEKHKELVLDLHI